MTGLQVWFDGDAIGPAWTIHVALSLNNGVPMPRTRPGLKMWTGRT